MGSLRKILLVATIAIAASAAGATAAGAATVYPNAFGPNWGNCSGYVTLERATTQTVRGLTTYNCTRTGASYEVQLQTGWRGFNDIWNTAYSTFKAPSGWRVLRSTQGMFLDLSPAYWACAVIRANGFQIANACAYYVL